MGNLSSYNVAVCIPAFEFPEGLTQTLNCLMRQTMRDFQVVIADDSQSEDVERLACIYEQPSHLNIKYIRRKHRGGARVASASNIAWLSSDVRPDGILIFANSHILMRPDWIEKHLRHHEKDHNRVVIGPYCEGSWEGPSTRSRWNEEKTEGCFKLMRMYGDSLRKNHLVSMGGWDEDFDGEWGFEDVDLAYRLHKLGLEFVHGTDVEVVHLSHLLTHPAPEGRKLGLRNVRILSQKHPELAYMLEQWRK